MTTLATTPAVPIPNRETAVAFTLTESGSNFIRVWCTAAPEGSELAGKLKDDAAGRVQVFESDGNALAPWRNKFDKGGVYSLRAQEYVKGASAHGGGYKGDPAGFRSETKAGSEATLTLAIAQRTELPISVGQDSATLVFYVLNATIKATSVALHGELTPTIEAPEVSRAATAAGSTNVTAALLALADTSVTTALGTISTVLSNMVSVLNAHFATVGSVHFSADSTSTIKNEIASAPTPSNLPNAVTEVVTRLRRHMTNDAGSGIGSANGVGGAPTRWHSPSAAVSDMLNAPLSNGAGGAADALTVLADVWRSYEAHRVSTAAHGVADNTNTLTALPKILDVIRYFLAALASTAPSPQPGQSSGSALLSQWGFRES